MNITYRLMKQDDIEGIFNVSNLSFNIPWSKDSLENEADNPLAKYIVSIETSTNEVIGYIGAWLIAGEADIMNIAVHPNFRKLGIGKNLLSSMINLCETLNCNIINLEVRKSNTAAICLYKKLNFSETGLRKEYYKDNKEDAILMQYKK